ncbi:DUF5717 family protein [Lachnoclostridium phytofermentans]|uniref:Uncharacterized protein n=1 Tax=Lachnoclostridium phytofermentans (strain ATCC 700394 / DSM 18823 / ISDg) TaxID=357809 RepID=A9KHH7_LACP7|nr:DUF5717 family protein [Lachnoclostridium phytofermentans]ABX40844.1 hypothetical protein Cphy_0457 [Lachnoclostridium phytofermentans ISDg]
MKEKIEQLAKGVFIYNLPEVILSEESLELYVECGSIYRGSFTIQNNQNTRMKGVLYSSNQNLHIENDRFIGEVSTIEYYFTAEYLETLTSYEETIHIISDCGEFVLPVIIHITSPSCESSVGKIKNLFEFAGLAQTNWEEAKEVFQSEKFGQVIAYYDNQYLLLYQALKKSSSASQALEEFLIATHKKVPASYQVDKTELQYEAGSYNFMDKLLIKKEGWGHSEVIIKSDAKFLQPQMNTLRMESFADGEAELNFVVQTEGMKEGLHYGNITIDVALQRFVIKVSVHCRRQNVVRRITLQKEKSCYVKLTKNYLDFRLDRISLSKYVSDAESILLTLLSGEKESIFYELFHLHLKLISGKEGMVTSTFEALEQKEEELKKTEPVAYGIYLYLKTLRKKSNQDALSVFQEVMELSEQYPKELFLFWCQLYLNKSYTSNPAQKLKDLKDRFQQGIHSPILYYEAALLLREDTLLLRELDSFELQVISFALRNHFLKKETATTVAYLASKCKVPHRHLLRILDEIYEQYGLKDALYAIISILIRGHKRETRYHRYYRLGMEKQLRITELPEYYIYSMGEEYQEIHPAVISYFTYENKLPDRKRAFYYACLLTKHRENMTIMEHHRVEMLQFLKRQLFAGVFHRHLTVIADALLPDTSVDTELAELIPKISFVHEVVCENPKIKSVAIVHKELQEECIVPLTEGQAFINLYTEQAQIFFIDHKEQRYYTLASYTLKKLTHLTPLLENCYAINPDQAELIIYLSEKDQFYQKFDEYTIELRKRIVQQSTLTKEYRREFVQTLIHYYYDNFEGEILESYLKNIDLKVFEQQSRYKMIEFMILREMYPLALRAMEELGYEGVEIKRLQRLCNHLLASPDEVSRYQEILLQIAFYLFTKGYYEEVTLSYLVKYFYGTTAQMYDLWKMAKEKSIDTLDLEERLLGQMLFAESYLGNAIQVFLSFYNKGCNRKLTRAFISFYSYKYLLRDRVTEPELFEVIRKELNYEENDVALRALLKHYSTKEQLTDDEVKFIDYHLSRLVQKGVVLPFFKEFKRNMRIPQHMYDKCYVEYHTNPKNRVVIHYSYGYESGEKDFAVEEMQNQCYGIFVKEFILFYNEELQYYITEITEQGEEVTESKTIIGTMEEEASGEDCYIQLNHIMEAKELKDDATVLRLLDNYVKQKFTIDTLFKAID